MTAKLAAGLLLALGSAAALNWGFFVQHGVAAELQRLSIRRPVHSLRMLFSNPRWLTGFLVGIGGWVLYIAALALAPLSLVQATSAGGIGLLALLVARSGRGRLTRAEWLGVGIALTGLVLLGLSLGGRAASGSRGAWSAIGVWVGLSVVAAALFGGPWSRVVAAGAGLGIASGLLYAAGDVATKAATAGGSMLWFVPVLLACHGLGFVSLQMGFQRGEALATAGVSSLFTNALPIAGGIVLFHDPVPGGLLGALRLMAFVTVVVGAAVLSRPTGQTERGDGVRSATRGAGTGTYAPIRQFDG